ncbi:MAG TPA: hypothetical protein VF228_21975 [Iamia sp.]
MLGDLIGLERPLGLACVLEVVPTIAQAVRVAQGVWAEVVDLLSA